MTYITKAYLNLEDRREFLLLQIAKLKQKNRQKSYLVLNKLKKQNDYLNKMADEISVSNKKKLELLAFELNKMLD